MKKEMNIFGVRKIAVTISLLLMAASVVIIALMGVKRGVQFVGGSEIQVKFRTPVDISDLRAAFKKNGFSHASIMQITGQNEFIIKLKGKAGDETAKGSKVSQRISEIFREASKEEKTSLFDLNKTNATDLAYLMKKGNPLKIDENEMIGEKRTVYDDIAEKIVQARSKKGDFFNSIDEALVSVTQPEVKDFLKKSCTLGNYIKLKEDTFSPSISSEQTEKAILAIVMALGAILVYISIRFKFNFAVGAVLALVHDVTISLGMFVLFKQEFTLPVVAAFLTIVGYSLNDTIVVFDRIRENLKIVKTVPLDQVINTSVVQTLTRTLLTSLTTLFVVVVIFFFGGLALKGFSFPLLVGIIVGTYSSIFIASPVYYFVEEHFYKEK
ncbi:MAG: protein translocase subunit SecF [Acidobacteria bacterium]|nr:MAG: protein translocase subunit SecF [Acidobacteriota bacterium]